MLRIVKATEPMPVRNIVLTIYGPPGLGKSSLAFTAEKPLMLDFDKGSYRAKNRKDAVPVQAWSDVKDMTAEDLAPYSTIVVDTAGRALDALGLDIIAGNPKMGRNSGVLSLQGFGELKGRFSAWQAFLRSLGKDLVLVCHMEEQKNGDDVMERIDAQGASKNEIYKSSDAMCRLTMNGNDRMLDFDPREGGFGKNPAQLPRLPFPNPEHSPTFLADVIKQIKESINRQTAEQAEAVKELDKWNAAITEADTLDAFNALLPLAKEKKDPAIIALIGKAAKARKYKANKSTGLYEEAAA